MPTITSREFNQHTSEAKKAAGKSPVFITDRGRPAHVLLSIEQYQKLTGKRPARSEKQPNIVELLAMPDGEEIDFEPGRLNFIPRSVDLD